MFHVGRLEVRQLVLAEQRAARGDEDAGAAANAEPPYRREHLHGLPGDVARRAENLREPLLGRQPVTGPQVLPRYVLQEPLGDPFIAGAVPLSLIAMLAFVEVSH